MTTLDALRSGGRLVTTGTFDLDPARAREKLARYQLVDPHRYVLQFVQAAQLLGATYITAKIDTDEVEMSFDGDSPSSAELAEIYLHAFGQRGIQRLEALRHLALGVIAAEAVEPAVIRVGGTGGTLTVRDANEQVDGEQTQPHNDIYVRERARLGHLVEFFRTIRGKTAEEVALLDARFATPRLTVNGETLNVPRRPPQGSIRVDTAQESGWVSVGRGDASITFVQHGVALEELSLPIGTLSVGGVVETSRLTTNLSQSAFVRNHMWDALIETVIMPAALRAADAFLSRQLRFANRPSVAAMIAAALRSRVDLGRRRESVEAVDEVVMRWADVDVWRRLQTRADPGRHLTTQELFNVTGDGPLFLSSIDEDLDLMRHRGAVVKHVLLIERDRDALSPRLLAEATGRRVVDLTDEVRAMARERSDRRFGDSEGLRVRDGKLCLNWARWSHVQRSDEPGIRVEIGVPTVRIRESAQAIVLVDGHIRLRTEVPAPLLGGCAMFVAVDEPTDEPPVELLRAAAPAITRAAVGLLDVDLDEAARMPVELLIDLLHACATGDVVRQVCGALGWGDELPDGVLDHLTEAREAAWLGSMMTSSAQTPLFERVRSRRRVSMRELAEAQPIRFIAAGSKRRALQIAWELELVGGGEVVWLDERERAILQWALGADALEDVEEDLHAAAARIQRGRTGFEEDPILHGLFVRKRALEGPGLRGEVGLTSPGGLSSFIELVVLHEGKRLAHRELSCGDGQFRAIVEAAALQPTADISDLVEDDAYVTLTRRIVAVCEELFEAWCVQRLATEEPLDESDELTLWRAVAHAAPERHAHRLGWPVFATTAGLLCADELRTRAKEGALVVSSQRVESGFAVFVPLAAAEHLLALEQILPEGRISRARHAMAASFEAPGASPGGDPLPPPADHPELVSALRMVGFDVDCVHVVSGSALDPNLRDRQLSIGELHPLRPDEPPDPRVIAAIGISIASGPDELAAALGALRGAR